MAYRPARTVSLAGQTIRRHELTHRKDKLIPGVVCGQDFGQVRLVEPSGIEPLTSCMPCRRSPS